jgi:hypothetical protein
MYVEEQAHGSADDRGAEAVGGVRRAEDVAREVAQNRGCLTASIQLNWLQTGYRQDVAWGPPIRFVYWSAE